MQEITTTSCAGCPFYRPTGTYYPSDDACMATKTEFSEPLSPGNADPYPSFCPLLNGEVCVKLEE